MEQVFKPLRVEILLIAIAWLIVWSKAESDEVCPVCTQFHYCQTSINTTGDYDGDGMNDQNEITLAQQFRPHLFLGNSTDSPWSLPSNMNPPFYAAKPHSSSSCLPYFYCQTLPSGTVSDGTAYYRVHPFHVNPSNHSYCDYIQVDYWFYYPWNIAECAVGKYAEHGHDWEHVSFCLAERDGQPLKLIGAKFFHHDYFNYYDSFSANQWVGNPGESGLKVYVANGLSLYESSGSHASYASPTGGICTMSDVRPGFCWCTEGASGAREIDVIPRPLWEVNAPSGNEPAWLNYPDGWPGYVDFATGVGHTYPPCGPAWGSHNYDWVNGSFSGRYFCGNPYTSFVTSTPYVEAYNTYPNGNPVIGGIRLTFDYMYADPVNDHPVILRRSWNPMAQDTSEWLCVSEDLPYGTTQYVDTVGIYSSYIMYLYKVHYFHRNSNPMYAGCSYAYYYNLNSGWIYCTHARPAPPEVDSCKNCVLYFHDFLSVAQPDSFWVMRDVDSLDDGVYQGSVTGLNRRYSLTNCGDRDYYVIAFNAYGTSYSPIFHAVYEPPGGGCPYLFAWDGARFAEENSIVGHADNAALAKPSPDFYRLQTCVPLDNGRYRLQIREFEQEQSSFDDFTLTAIEHPAATLVNVTKDGRMSIYRGELLPVSAIDDQGVDCLAAVIDEDGVFFWRQTAGTLTLTYLVGKGFGTQSMALTQSPPEPPSNKKLAADSSSGSSRPGLMTTEVLASDGSWVQLDALADRANDGTEHITVDPTDYISGGQIVIRRSWETNAYVDKVSLLLPSAEEPQITELQLVAATHSQQGDILNQVMLQDDDMATLIPGESIELQFADPIGQPVKDGYVRDFVFSANGYYTSYKGNAAVPETYRLLQNYPNPFNPSTTIYYSLVSTTNVDLAVYNMLGQKVKTLVNTMQQAGNQSVVWDGTDDGGSPVASGIYLYTLTTPDYTASRKMILMK
jgi:hypothetical protein